jgi:type VII secretion-associated serine protease mycosin
VRRTNRSILLGSAMAIALALLVTACAPTPAPSNGAVTAPDAPPPGSTPIPGPCPSSVASTAVGTGGNTSDLGTATSSGTASTDQVVVVAVDDEGRPELVTTSFEDVASTAASLADDPALDVVAVETDRTMRVAGSVTATGGDPYRSQQWALDTLQVATAWAISTGAQVDVAVIDTGVKGTHTDLAGKVCNGVAFLNSTGVAQLGQGATDPHGHGTHVAGTVAALRGNGVGVAGVAPSARIIPVRVLDAQGNGSSSDVARGITWAVDHGAEVVNLSLGGGYSSAVQVAVDYAESQGVVVVAAAGNAGPGGPPNYPAALPEALAVGSHDKNGLVSSFSTRGGYVDLSAPGSGILSTAHDGSWVFMSGTSMATPHVAGVVALMLAAEPGLTPNEVRTRLQATAVDAGSAGHDESYGWGRVNLLAALAG